MMKSEFEARIGHEIDPSIYKDIEYVYNYHPSDMDKDEAAKLYTMFGPLIFEVMRPQADEAFQHKEHIRDLEQKAHDIKLEIESIKMELAQLREDWNSSYTVAQWGNDE